jgi:hypothetical protein
LTVDDQRDVQADEEGDRLGGAVEPAQPEADAVLLCLPAAVRPCPCGGQLGAMLAVSGVFMAMKLVVCAGYRPPPPPFASI